MYPAQQRKLMNIIGGRMRIQPCMQLVPGLTCRQQAYPSSKCWRACTNADTGFVAAAVALLAFLSAAWFCAGAGTAAGLEAGLEAGLLAAAVGLATDLALPAASFCPALWPTDGAGV